MMVLVVPVDFDRERERIWLPERCYLHVAFSYTGGCQNCGPIIGP